MSGTGGRGAGVTGSDAAVECRGLSHTYRDDEGADVVALVEVDLRVAPGEAVALVGPSGVGKSTLMTLVAGLVRPTRGRVLVGGAEVTQMSERQLLALRARELGVMLQTPARNLLPYATALQNVDFAQGRGRRDRAARRAESVDLVEQVGLADQRDRAARFLSGGQQQRLALAVALAGRPAVLLADEPTSQLDTRNGDAVVALMLDARDRLGTALVVVTHDPHVSDALDTVYALRDGSLVPGPAAGPVPTRQP